ncbi:MAG: hypothetical protein GXO95_01905 [Nitrospirae bacterium]|nr:hypothetical protein [Nitrospirota bacterium]
MSSLDLTKNLLNAKAGISNEWGSAGIQGEGLATFRTEFNHGLRLDAGIGVLANLDASFRKYIAAHLMGEAHAQLRVTGQVQVPMNLFEEVGVAVRLQAIAEAAAGVSLNLGLSIGDFIKLAESDPQLEGLPAKLFRVFMEEVTIGGGVYAKAAFSAMAYANLVIAGRLVKGNGPGEEPGFNILAEAGAGLEAGAGYRVFANIGINNPRRLAGRTIDVVVDEMVDEISKLIPEDSTDKPELLNAFRVPAKIALRNAYEIGELIATRDIPANESGARQIALRCTQVILEESQRYLLDRIACTGMRILEDNMKSFADGISDTDWEELATERQNVANRLLAIPNDPFLPGEDNRRYWNALCNDVLTLVMKISEASISDDLGKWLQPVSMLWSAIQLLFIGMERVTEASASVNIVGWNNPESVQKAFFGDLESQPPQSIKSYINAQLENGVNHDLNRSELALFLLKDGVIRNLEARFPDVKVFLDIFRRPLSPVGSDTDIAKLLLTSLGGILIDSDGQVDTKATLDALLNGLKTFLTDKLEGELVPVVDNYIGDRGDLRFYFHEVVLPSLRLTTDVVFTQVLEWEEGNVDETALKEMLSTVLMMLFGRSLVVTTDVLTAAAQSEIRTEFNKAADEAGDQGGLVDTLLPILEPLGLYTASDRDEVLEIVQDILVIGGDVFGPLPDQTRARVRGLLYEIFEPLPPDGQHDFMENLADALFIPNRERVMGLADELVAIAGNNLQNFIARVLQRIAGKMLEELDELIKDIEKQVKKWLSELEEALQLLQRQVAALLREIAVLISEVEELFNRVADDFQELLSILGNNASRNRIRDKIVSSMVSTAENRLRSNPIYKNLLPGPAKTIAKTTMETTVRAGIDNAVTNTIWGAICDLTWDLNDFIEDVRGLSPHQGLASGISNLLLNRIDDRLRSVFGDNPGMDISFDVRWSVRVPYYDIPAGKWKNRTLTHRESINLGHVELPLSTVLSNVRWVIEHTAAVEEQINVLARGLYNALEKELQLKDKDAEHMRLEEEKMAVESEFQESVPADRDINIYEPVPGAVYEDNLAVKIELSGVPVSFLGLGMNEQQRVYVWLNAELIPLDSFIVDEVRPMLPAITDLSEGFSGLLQGKNVSGKQTAPEEASLKSSNVTVRRYVPGLQVDRWGTVLPVQIATPDQPIPHTISPFPKGMTMEQRLTTIQERCCSVASETSTAPATQLHMQEVVSGSPGPQAHRVSHLILSKRSSKFGLPAGISELPVNVQRNNLNSAYAILSGPGNVKKDSAGKTAGGYDRDAIPVPLPGRRLTAMELESVTQAASYQHLRLTRAIPLTELEEGMNTLVVAIIDGREKKIEKAVSFIATRALETEKEKKEPRLPTRISREDRGKHKPGKVKGKAFLTPAKKRREAIDRSRKTLRLKTPDYESCFPNGGEK